MSLKRAAFGAIKWTSLATIYSAALQLLKIAILARLIDKEDFGLFAIVMTVIGFSNFIVEAGLGNAVIHKQNASKAELGSAYSINLVLGLIIFFANYLISLPIADFYNQVQLISLLKTSSIIFLILPWGLQYTALFKRDLHFDYVAKIDIFSNTISFLSAVIFAYFDYGIYALIYSQIINILVRTLYLLISGTKKYGFNFNINKEDAKYFFRFGSFQIAENLINYFNTQLDTLIIGKILNTDDLGLYYMAKQIAFRPLQVINPIVTQVAFPLFSKIQNEISKLKSGFLQIVQFLSIVLGVVYATISIFSYETINLFFGKNWTDAGPLLVILSIYYLVRGIGNPIGTLILSRGFVDLGFYWNVFMLIYTFIVVLVGAKWGLIGIASAYLFISLSVQIPYWRILIHRLCGASAKEYFFPLFKIFGYLLLCYLPIYLMFDTKNFIQKIIFYVLTTGLFIFLNKKTILELLDLKKINARK